MAFHRPGAMKPTPPIMKALKSVVWYQVRPVTLTEPEARSTSAILRGRGRKYQDCLGAEKKTEQKKRTRHCTTYTAAIQT